MATRAEQNKTNAQRTNAAGRVSIQKPRKSAWSHDKLHAAAKATQAFEESNGARPSPESTRGSANRAKSDAARNIAEGIRRGAPSNLARDARVRATHVRGFS